MGICSAFMDLKDANMQPVCPDDYFDIGLLGALAHLATLLLEATHTLLLPLPAHLGCGLLPWVGLVGTSTTEAKHQVQGGLLLDVVVLKGTAILELLAREDETLLVGGDALLVLDLGLDGLNGVCALNLEGDGLPRQCLDEDLHLQHQLRKQEGDEVSPM